MSSAWCEEGWSQVVSVAIATLLVAEVVHESVCDGATRCACDRVVGVECFAVWVAFGVDVHGLSAPVAGCAVAVLDEELCALLLVLPSELACCRGLVSHGLALIRGC